MDILLIDGYNVIYSTYQDIMQELGHARERLEADLAEYAAYEGIRAVVVYDAHSVAGAAGRIEFAADGLEVVYTAAGETADSFIEKLAYQLIRQGERVYVVTSDRMEQTVILGTGAYRVTARELAARINHVKQKIREAAQAIRRHDRRELASRINGDVAARLDRLRRR